MVRVFVWNFRSTKEPWGHASLDVNGTYTSWLPMGENRRDDNLDFIRSVNLFGTPNDVERYAAKIAQRLKLKETP